MHMIDIYTRDVTFCLHSQIPQLLPTFVCTCDIGFSSSMLGSSGAMAAKRIPSLLSKALSGRAASPAVQGGRTVNFFDLGLLCFFCRVHVCFSFVDVEVVSGLFLDEF